MERVLSDPEIWKYVSIPFVAALVGWVTNWVAIRMTFRPVEFVGIRPWFGWQGIIPSKAGRMAAIFVDRTMFRLGTLRELLQSMQPERIAEHVSAVMTPRLERYTDEVMFYSHAKVWRMLPESARQDVYRRVREELPRLVRPLVAEIVERVEELVDFRGMLVEMLESDRKLLNRLFLEAGAAEFRFIIRSGLYFGFLFGLIQLTVWILFPSWWVLPAFGFMVGWATNWFAINIVFRPLEPRRVGPWRIQGLFLKRQLEVSAAWCRLVTTEIVTLQRIIYAMLYGPRAEKTRGVIRKHIQPIADEVIARYGNAAAVAVGDATTGRIRRMAGEKAVRVSSDAFDHWPFNRERARLAERLLRERMEQMPPAEFQDLLRPCFQEDEIKLIVLGGVLGLLAGIAQLLFVFGIPA
ncbi:MAG: hypothetical protein GY716_03220 [bacterium]|nr:hypothetical protein [bacterium]